jgi:two-component system, cell cycle response regulator
MTSQENTTAGQLTRQVLEQVVSRTSEGIVVADARAEGLPVVYANPAYETLTGYTLQELTGSACPLLRSCAAESSQASPPEVEKLQQAIDRAQSCEVIVPDLRKDGSRWFSEVNVEPLFDDGGEVQYLLFRQRPASTVPDSRQDRAATDVATGDERAAHWESKNEGKASSAAVCSEVQLLQRELGRARQKIDSASRTDSRTGLLRLEYFAELVERDLDIARREKTGVALMLFEVMEFDAYRATFGGSAAESCLRMIAAQLNGTLRRASDLATRCTETSYVAFVRARDRDEARALAQRIQRNVRGLGLHNPRAAVSRHVGVSPGVVHVVPGPEDDLDSLLVRAREDMQQGTMPVPAQVSRTS